LRLIQVYYRRPAKCSRWKELITALQFHAEVAHRGCIPSEFRFLNAASPLQIGYDVSQPADNFEVLRGLLNDGSPGGGTPLVIVIATDGEASDGDVRDALRPLKDLPVWIVLRFCTDEDRIVNLWNSIDSELELNMDVIDDFFGEAEEIHKVNPWLTYGEPLHRLREFGITLRELDKIDEQVLSADDFVRICKLM
jgi:hypothetical protein